MKPSRHAFTLVELIIVLVVIGLILGLVVPRIGNISWGITRSQTLKAIASSFYMASSIALATGQPSQLTFRLDENKIVLKRGKIARTDANGENDGVSKGSIFDDVEEFPLSAKVSVGTSGFYGENNQVVYHFFPNGEATGPHISLSLGDRYHLSLDVDRLTGRPLLHDNEP